MNRYESMMNHLLVQFSNTKVLQAIFCAISDELQLLDDTFNNLKEKRWIDTGEGAQLDGIGEIVDRNRLINNAITINFFGFENQINTTGFNQARFREYSEPYLSSTSLSDEEYRLILWAKVNKNNSLCYMNDTIKSIQFIFKTDIAIVQDIYNAKFIVGIGRKLTKNEILFANALDLIVRPAGVSCQSMTHFDKDNVFGFYNQKFAKGFGQAPLSEIFSNNLIKKGYAV